MADDEDEGWGGEIGKQGAPKAGLTKDTMRKARAMNPNLASQGSTTELLNKVKGIDASKAAPSTKTPQAGELATTLEKIEQVHLEDKKRAQAELAKAQKIVADVAPKTLDRLIDVMLRLDPDLVSPITHEFLKSKAAFLGEVGFSIRKVLDRQLKKK